ncbi:uncharacterized protein LOC132258530 [Phlebotomus argentipes]|uniref:uncharacterized protein LOC132258530 n=1 Tax=Phlebotomus argentipes TaxID=94469 RepID=UPI002892CC76|nr:uncharacterized protein LOC132258530 [Phlebotomus argentipes]
MCPEAFNGIIMKFFYSFFILPSFFITTTLLNVIAASETLDPKCGKPRESLDFCMKDINSLERQIPQSLQEIHQVCSAFVTGMKCTDDYLTRCIDQRERKIIESEIHGARHLYDHLCRNRGFQKDFLKHLDCIISIRPRWDACSEKFVREIKEDISKHFSEEAAQKRYVDFCCNRRDYESCVYNEAKEKCSTESANFIREIVKILSTEKKFSDCEKFEKHCKNEQICVTNWPLLIVICSFILIARNSLLNVNLCK